MVFTSLSFLLLFLMPVLLVYHVLPEKFRNYWLLGASLLFYAFDEPKFVLLLLAMILWTWGFGLLIAGSVANKKLLLIICTAGQISVLAFFKYASYIGVLSDNSIAMPVGLSFYTFQSISYAIDIYRGEEEQRNPLFFALYLSFFPQLIAGPIVRYTELGPQLRSRQADRDKFTGGLLRFTMGLSKKVLLADSLARLADYVFDSPDITQLHPGMVWLGVLAFTLQIYFDFSGYSDMAIGLGAMFGFTLPENFDYPYLSKTATEFWRRWHMTLSRWFRDYVYIPLGGNRKGFAKECVTLLLVWSLTGIWHGAGPTYLVWGLLWGLLLIVEKGLIRPQERGSLFRGAYRVFLLIWIMLLWVIFRSSNLETAWQIISYMFSLHGSTSGMPGLKLWLHDMWPYLAIGAALSMGGFPFAKARLQKALGARGRQIIEAAGFIGMLLITVTAVSFIISKSYEPFLYFNF